jgi:hypothetical protein
VASFRPFVNARELTRAHSYVVTGVYNPKAFFLHAASLRQACAHCGRFSTAASRRSLASVSVPVWPTDLSVRLPVVGLVGRYPANYLIGLELLPGRKVLADPHRFLAWTAVHVSPSGITRSFPRLSPSRGQIARVLLTLSPLYSPLRAFTFDLHA